MSLHHGSLCSLPICVEVLLSNVFHKSIEPGESSWFVCCLTTLCELRRLHGVQWIATVFRVSVSDLFSRYCPNIRLEKLKKTRKFVNQHKNLLELLPHQCVLYLANLFFCRRLMEKVLIRIVIKSRHLWGTCSMKHALSVFENTVLRRMFVLREEPKGMWENFIGGVS
jgi:hypothetical protein